jgi:hypothetical protein
MREFLWLVWLAAHALVSAGIAFGAVLVGPQPTYGPNESVAFYVVLALQFIAAVFIVCAARDKRKLPAGVLAVAAMVWAACCLLVAGMALSGSWL